MAQADSVPTANRAPITGAWSTPSTKRVLPIERYFVGQTDRIQVCAVGYATAVLLLGWFPWNVLLILVLFLCRSSRSGSSS
jgi:hypothetical protein